MKFTELTDNEILLRLSEQEKKSGIRLTFAQNMFYLSLLDYAEHYGIYDEGEEQYYIQLSVSEFVEKFKTSHTTVVQSLKLLNECGVIRRVKNKRMFRKLSKGEYDLNGAYRTYINVQYLQI